MSQRKDRLTSTDSGFLDRTLDESQRSESPAPSLGMWAKLRKKIRPNYISIKQKKPHGRGIGRGVGRGADRRVGSKPQSQGNLGKEALHSFAEVKGSGGFKVFEVKLRNKWLSCKVFPIKRFGTRDDLKAGLQQMIDELNVLRGLRHQYILSIETVIHIPDQETGIPSLIVYAGLMEGSLKELVQKSVRMKEDESLLWFRQISDALNYLHDMNVSHLDINPNNILYQRIQNQLVYKLTDFGLAKVYNEDGSSQTSDQARSSLFKSPELIEGNHFISVSSIWPQKYDTRICDIYSLGITLAYTLIGSLNKQGETAFDWVVNNLCKKIGFDMREGVIDLIIQMTQTDPIRRYAIDNVVSHYWLKENEE